MDYDLELDVSEEEECVREGDDGDAFEGSPHPVHYVLPTPPIKADPKPKPSTVTYADSGFDVNDVEDDGLYSTLDRELLRDTLTAMLPRMVASVLTDMHETPVNGIAERIGVSVTSKVLSLQGWFHRSTWRQIWTVIAKIILACYLIFGIYLGVSWIFDELERIRQFREEAGIPMLVKIMSAAVGYHPDPNRRGYFDGRNFDW